MQQGNNDLDALDKLVRVELLTNTNVTWVELDKLVALHLAPASTSDMQAIALLTLRNIARCNLDMLLERGHLTKVLPFITSPDRLVRACALAVMAVVACSRPGRELMKTFKGLLTQLVALLSNQADGLDTGYACLAVANWAMQAEVKAALLRLGAVPVLVGLVRQCVRRPSLNEVRHLKHQAATWWAAARRHGLRHHPAGFTLLADDNRQRQQLHTAEEDDVHEGEEGEGEEEGESEGVGQRISFRPPATSTPPSAALLHAPDHQLRTVTPHLAGCAAASALLTLSTDAACLDAMVQAGLPALSEEVVCCTHPNLLSERCRVLAAWLMLAPGPGSSRSQEQAERRRQRRPSRGSKQVPPAAQQETPQRPQPAGPMSGASASASTFWLTS